MLKIHLALLFLMLAQGCANDCSDDPPPVAPVTFYITDQAGRNLVNTSGTVFHPDSVQFFLDNEKTFFRKEYDSQQNGYKFMIYPGGRVSGSDLFYIYLDRSDTDTLEVFYTVEQGRCFPLVSYTLFFFNGVQVYRNSQDRVLTLRKNS